MVCAAMAAVSCYEPEHPTLPLAQAEVTLVRAFCDRVVDCGCGEGIDSDHDACVEEVGALVDALQLADQGGALRYDPSCYGEYVAALDERGCGGAREHDHDCKSPCKPVHGEQPEGASCTRQDRFDDCAQGLVCDYDCGSGECLDRCIDPCSDASLANCGDEHCAATEVCTYDDAGSRCVTRPSAGMPCVQGECAADSQCVFDPNTGESTCVARGELGTACTGHRFCASGYCPAGFCETKPGLHDDCAGARVCEAPYVCSGETDTCETAPPAICEEYLGQGVG